MAKNRWLEFLIFGIIFFLVAANCTLARIVLDEVNRDRTNTVAVRLTIHSSTYTWEAETNDSLDATNWQASQVAQTAT